MIFSAGQAARELWSFGEDELADRALRIPDSALASMWWEAAEFYDQAYPLPVSGRKITLGHVIAFAAMSHLTGELRPLARLRRRPAKDLPEEIGIVALPFSGDTRQLQDHYLALRSRSI